MAKHNVVKLNFQIIIISFVVLSNLRCSNHSDIMPYIIQVENKSKIHKDTFYFNERNFSFEPIYIGKSMDTIVIQTITPYEVVREISSDYHCIVMHEDCPEIGILEATDLNIHIDTLRKIKFGGIDIPIPPPPPPPEQGCIPDGSFEVINRNKIREAYVVLIQNKSNQNAVIGTFLEAGIDLEMIQYDEWVTIEDPFRGCGYDESLILPPNEILITAIPIFDNLKGEKLRLKLGPCISETFSMK
jgi:hypothetical protein